MGQNQILFVAVQNLDPPVFQALTQLKILFAGVFSYVLLNKRLSQVQWVALLLLASGAALVQVEASMCKVVSNKNEEADPFWGLVAVITMSVMSGLAGCYTEKMLKTEKLPECNLRPRHHCHLCCHVLVPGSALCDYVGRGQERRGDS